MTPSWTGVATLDSNTFVMRRDVSQNALKSAKRRFVRFKPDQGAFAQIDFSISDREFSCAAVGLIVEQAPMGGCHLITLGDVSLSPGDVCRIKLGELPPLRAKVVWSKALDSDVMRIGFQFLE